jgi:hypothetical protein
MRQQGYIGIGIKVRNRFYLRMSLCRKSLTPVQMEPTYWSNIIVGCHMLASFEYCAA